MGGKGGPSEVWAAEMEVGEPESSAEGTATRPDCPCAGIPLLPPDAGVSLLDPGLGNSLAKLGILLLAASPLPLPNPTSSVSLPPAIPATVPPAPPALEPDGECEANPSLFCPLWPCPTAKRRLSSLTFRINSASSAGMSSVLMLAIRAWPVPFVGERGSRGDDEPGPAPAPDGDVLKAVATGEPGEEVMG